MTASSIAGVSLPVNVFCWLGCDGIARTIDLTGEASPSRPRRSSSLSVIGERFVIRQ